MKHVTANASKKPAPKGGRKVMHMSIQRAANGFTTRTNREQPKSGGMSNYEEPETNVFPDGVSLHKHIAKSFADAEDAAEAKAGKETD